MRKNLTRQILLIVISTSLIYGGTAFGQNPYGDEPTKATKKTTPTKPAVKPPPKPAQISVEDLSNLNKAANVGNEFSRGEYKNFVVGFPIVQAKLTFNDISKNYDRASWFQQILSEHGCQTISFDKKETKTGSFLSRVTTWTVTSQIKGRSFVVEAIAKHYGGSLIQQPGSPTAPTDPALADVVALEMKNKDLELEVLRNSFEVDKLMVARSKVGALNFSEKNRIDAALKDLKERKIPAGKSAIAQNSGAISGKLVDLGVKAQESKNYNLAISLYGISGSKTDSTKYNTGTSYLGLKQYDSAINQFKTMSSSNGELAYNGIAEAQHGKGNDREALNSLYDVLSGFGNSKQELEALSKIDKWGYLKRADEFPEITGKLSQTYLNKGLLDASSNPDLASKDFSRAVDIRANGGNKKEASQAILSEYSATLTQNRQDLSTAKQSAGQRFDREREQARQNVYAWENAYNQAVSRARSEYDYDLTRKRREMNDAKRDLEDLLARPPSKGGSTDPYSGGGSSTDPYAKKPATGGGSTDPYSGGSSTDPYSKKSGSTTDPYAKKTGSSTDPYSGGSPGSNTDPYNGNAGGSTTDPYEVDRYNSNVEAARARVERLDREYRWLYANETSYVDQKVLSEANSLQDARSTYARYDPSRKDSYISNDSEVSRLNRAVSLADSNYRTVGQMAKAAGY